MKTANRLYPLLNETSTAYEFSWGYIKERKIGQHVIWDYYFTKLLSRYVDSGQCASDLQRSVFNEIEQKVACSTRDILVILDMNDGWYVFPSFSEATLCQITHFSQEEKARQWAMNTMINDIVPAIILSLEHKFST